jgi:ABC-type nitrate/sulfonate/bicarbonate transport system permease component
MSGVTSLGFRRRSSEQTTARQRARKWTRPAFAVFGLAMLLVIWEVGAVIVRQTASHPNEVWPSLEYIARTAYPEIGLVRHTAIASPSSPSAASGGHASYTDATVVLLRESRRTVQRVLLGAIIGVLAGLAVGLAVARSPISRRTLYPTVNLLRQIPLLALSILFLLWFGSTERAIYAFVIFGVGSLIMINTINAVRNVPAVQVNYARTLGSSDLRVLRSVVLPAIVPELVGGIKVAVGLAWAMVLGTEYVIALPGLGKLMLFFELFGYAGRMVVILFLFVLFALLTHLLVSAAGNYVTRWVPRSQ